MWRCYLNLFNLLLIALTVMSFLSADAKATTVIGVMVMLSTVIRFVQERRSHRAAPPGRRRHPFGAAGVP